MAKNKTIKLKFKTRTGKTVTYRAKKTTTEPFKIHFPKRHKTKIWRCGPKREAKKVEFLGIKITEKQKEKQLEKLKIAMPLLVGLWIFNEATKK